MALATEKFSLLLVPLVARISRHKPCHAFRGRTLAIVPFALIRIGLATRSSVAGGLDVADHGAEGSPVSGALDPEWTGLRHCEVHAIRADERHNCDVGVDGCIAVPTGKAWEPVVGR